MSLLFTSLDAVTTTGVGNQNEFDVPKPNISMQVSFTGSPSSVVVDLEGSIDGVNFIRLAEVSTDASGSGSMAKNGNGGDSTVPIAFVRANLKTLSGGTMPTVTVVIAAA